MNNLTESYIRKIIRDVISKSLFTEISSEEKIRLMNKSVSRVPFSQEMMKQAIEQGREIGINYRSKNDKYEMPITKSRIIHPVAMGTNNNGDLVFRGLQIAGQSEKEARETGVRSAEVGVEKDGINAWRMFKKDNLKSMWFTDGFFSDNKPGYNSKDKGMASIIVSYDPNIAKQYQDSLIGKKIEPQTTEPIEPANPIVNPVPNQSPAFKKIVNTQRPKTNFSSKDVEQIGYQPKNLFK